MFRKIRIAALSAVIGLGTLAGAPATAQADGLYFSFGNSGTSAGVHLRDRGRSGRHQNWRGHHRRACSPGEAVHKAGRYGVRHARVVDVDRRVIRVAGRKFHRRVSMSFGRAANCPVVAW